MRIICHPEVAQRIRQGLVKVPNLDRPQDPLWWGDLNIQEDQYMEREKPTGKYIDQQGNVMAKDEIRVSDRFVEYGPEDLELLLFLGLLKPERKTMAYFFNSYNYSFMPKYMGLMKSSV